MQQRSPSEPPATSSVLLRVVRLWRWVVLLVGVVTVVIAALGRIFWVRQSFGLFLVTVAIFGLLYGLSLRK
jgi:hypothetical protein